MPAKRRRERPLRQLAEPNLDAILKYAGLKLPGAGERRRLLDGVNDDVWWADALRQAQIATTPHGIAESVDRALAYCAKARKELTYVPGKLRGPLDNFERWLHVLKREPQTVFSSWSARCHSVRVTLLRGLVGRFERAFGQAVPMTPPAVKSPFCKFAAGVLSHAEGKQVDERAVRSLLLKR